MLAVHQNETEEVFFAAACLFRLSQRRSGRVVDETAAHTRHGTARHGSGSRNMVDCGRLEYMYILLGLIVLSQDPAAFPVGLMNFTSPEFRLR